MPRAGGRNKLQPIPKKELSRQIVSENKKLGLANAQLKDGIKENEKHLEDSDKKLSVLKSEINKSEKILKSSSAVEEDLEAVKFELEKTNSTLLDIQRESTVQRNNLDNIHSEFSEKVGLLEKLESEIELNKSKLKSSSQEVIKVESVIETKSSKVDLLNKEIKLADSDLENLKNKYISELSGLDKQLESKKIVSKESTKGLEEKKTGLESSIKKLNTQMTQLNLIIEKETSQHRLEIDKMVKDKGVEIEKVDKEVGKLQKEINEKQSQLDSVKKKHNIEKEKFEQTKENVHQFRIDVADEVSKQKIKQKLSNISVAGLADALK